MPRILAIDVRPGEHHLLGFAVQLDMEAFPCAFLPDPIDVPEHIVAHVKEQLGIAHPKRGRS